MNNKYILNLIILFLLSGCIGASSTGVFGTGVSIAMDPRTLGTQIDDSIMDKSLDARLVAMNKNYLLNVKTKVLDGRIFLTSKLLKNFSKKFIIRDHLEKMTRYLYIESILHKTRKNL